MGCNCGSNKRRTREGQTLRESIINEAAQGNSTPTPAAPPAPPRTTFRTRLEQKR